MEVYLLWHAHHTDDEDGRARHRHTLDGNWFCDEQMGDDAKLIGVYSTRDKARAATDRARMLPGFRKEPECFVVDAYALNEDGWTTGYLPG